MANNILHIAELLKGKGINNIYGIPQYLELMPLEKMNDFDKTNFVVPIEDYAEPYIVKWLLYEGCNLNCSGCTHFSPVNQSPKMLSVQEFRADLIQLKNNLHYLKKIQLLGGEPLLNKNLDKFILTAHEIFPYSQLSIITNGLLIPSLGEETLEIIHKYVSYIVISVYPPTEKMIDRIKDTLDKHKIRYNLSFVRGKFRLQYNTLGNKDSEEQWSVCQDRLCFTVIDGKISQCYYAGTVKHANHFFGLNIPYENAMFSIYDMPSKYTGAELIKMLNKPTSLCAFCNTVNSKNAPMTEWKIAKQDSEKRVSDWFYDSED